MRCKVQLYVAGKTFYEEIEATDYQHARQIALARNPGATVVSVNADFGTPDHTNYRSSWVDEYEAPKQTYHSSGTSGLGSLGLLVGGVWFVGWLAWEAWKFGSAIIVAAWQWFVGLFSWIPFVSPQLIVGLVLGFFFLVLILGALDG